MSSRDAEPGGPLSGEDALIQAHFAPLARGEAGAFGLTDDAACLNLSGNTVVTTDTLVSGVHFLSGDPPGAVGHKALAVNLSDLAAKGAHPDVYFLNLAIPSPANMTWVAAFAHGLDMLQRRAGCRLAGGDTVSTSGPITITITALGAAGPGGMVPRGCAQAGDLVYVSGTIGDAALGLRLAQDTGVRRRWALDDADAVWLVERYRRPEPRLALRDALNVHARAAMDVSDGLAQDLAKMCAASGAGARIDAASIPFSGPGTKVLSEAPKERLAMLSGGDDYEILAAIPPQAARAFEADAGKAGVPVTCLGRFGEPSESVRFVDEAGRRLAFETAGFDHFREV